jgi:hypothetical protein
MVWVMPIPRVAPRSWSLLVVTGCLCMAVPASAQGRSGFWIGGGVGVGTAQASINGRELDRDGVPVLHVDGGWTLSPQVLLGVRMDSLGLRLIESGGPIQKAAVVDVLGTLTLYPRAASRWFVRGGVGGTFVDEIEEGPFDVQGRGFSAMAGLGYDVPLGRAFAITPAVSYRYGRVDGLRLGGLLLSEQWRHNVVAATVSLTFN